MGTQIESAINFRFLFQFRLINIFLSRLLSSGFFPGSGNLSGAETT